MIKPISLEGRKRTGELANSYEANAEFKKEELLALKLQAINEDAKATGTLEMVATDRITPDPGQPRKIFRNIDSLAESIRVQGIIQPIIVTPRLINGYHQIIAGERRFLAAKQVGLAVIPCIVREADDANIVILQLLENDQREAVSPLEESDALAKLVHTMGVSKVEVAQELGRDAAWVSIRLGLQQASEEIKSLVTDGLIEDVRTLHELRMFEQEHPESAKQLMTRIRRNQLSGSYRQVIAALRTNIKSKTRSQPLVRKIQKIEKIGNRLLVHITKGKHPIEFQITPEVLVQFLASVTYD